MPYEKQKEEPRMVPETADEGGGSEGVEETPKVNKAQVIRDLSAKRMSIAQIRQTLELDYGIKVSYQHVYNTIKYSAGMNNGLEAHKASKVLIGTRENKVMIVHENAAAKALSAELKSMQKELEESNFDPEKMAELIKRQKAIAAEKERAVAEAKAAKQLAASQSDESALPGGEDHEAK